MTGTGCQVAGPTVCLKLQVVLVVKNPPASAGVPSSIPGLGGFPRGGHSNHSSPLAWRTPWTEEPGGLQSMGSQRQD